MQVQLQRSAAASGNMESATAAESALKALSSSALGAPAYPCSEDDAAVSVPDTQSNPAAETSDGTEAGFQRAARASPGLRQRSSALNPATDKMNGSWEDRSSGAAAQAGSREGTAPGFKEHESPTLLSHSAGLKPPKAAVVGATLLFLAICVWVIVSHSVGQLLPFWAI